MRKTKTVFRCGRSLRSIRLGLAASLVLWASASLQADLKVGDPNYTGPPAPTLQLPELSLPSSQAFVHPGMLQSQKDLEFIQARLEAGEEPWTSALKAMQADPYCSLAIKPLVIPEIDPHGNSAGYLMKDSSSAYGHALLWCLTGKKEHADKAIELINANSKTLRVIQPGRNNQSRVVAGWTASKFASAAELLAHYKRPDGSTAGWSAEDQDRCRTMLKTIFYPQIENFQPTFNGNWDATMINAMMCIGIFCNDHAMFNRAVDYYLHGEGNGSLSHYIHGNGQNQESGRDQTHAQMGLGALAAACEIAWKQGLDLYGMADNRLAVAFEYTAKYNLGENVEVIGEVPISAKGRGRFMPVYEIVYQHYAVDKGLPMPFSRQILDKTRPEGLDLIILQAWGTLTSYRGPALAPTAKP